MRKHRKRPRYILLVEDNVHHAELLTELLDRHFAPVIIHTVDTIADGVEFARKGSYDLILTDAIVGDAPVTDDLPTLIEHAGTAPIVVISGHGDERLAAELIRAGAAEYLVKSRETLEHLPLTIEKHLSAKKHSSSSSRKRPQSKGKEAPPTPAEIMHEMDRLTQQALAIAHPRRRNKRGQAGDSAQLERLLNQIRRLRNMAEKLTGEQ